MGPRDRIMVQHHRIHIPRLFQLRKRPLNILIRGQMEVQNSQQRIQVPLSGQTFPHEPFEGRSRGEVAPPVVVVPDGGFVLGVLGIGKEVPMVR